MKKKKDQNQTPDTESVVETETESAVEETEATVEDTAEQVEATPQQWQEALELCVRQRDQAAKERDEFKDSYLRTQADFQNFKRRNQTARADGYEDGVREAIAAVLPAIDNLERALDAAEKQGVSDGLTDGVRMTLNTMLESLKRFGLEEVPALGEDFDPDKHNAVMREAGDTPGKVLEVFQKGYKVKEKIIRYAMVKVCAD